MAGQEAGFVGIRVKNRETNADRRVRSAQCQNEVHTGGFNHTRLRFGGISDRDSKRGKSEQEGKGKRDAFIKRIKDVKASYPQDFKEKRDEEGDEAEEADSNNDGSSLHSERMDRDEELAYDVQQAPPVAAQDLQAVFKSGYLEKRRKDHSFFGTEWQKRWCALSNHTFYYYGNEKDKQQKGEFNITGYTVKMNNTLRKDSKKDCCFEIAAPDKRVYQFCASSQKEAEEWVEQISFVLKDMEGTIPLEEEQDFYDDCLPFNAASMPAPIDDDIYEELPDEEVPHTNKPAPEPVSKPPVALPVTAVNKSTDYQNYFQGLWDCTGDQPDELSFKRGDTIYILSKEYETFGWWVGEIKGVIGIVPKSYLTELYIL